MKHTGIFDAYAHGKINAITVNGQPLLQNITHAPFGPLSGWTWGNGLPHFRAHGLDGKIQLIESAIAQNYSYDAAGQLTQIHQWSQLAPPQYDTVKDATIGSNLDITVITLQRTSWAPETRDVRP